MPIYHEYSAEELLEWERAAFPIVRIDTMVDTVFSGLAAAMLPIIVRWSASSAGFGPDNYYLVSNVNIGGNPVDGTSLLASIRIPGDAVDRVEFVTVMSKIGRIETEVGHSMLRFIFKDDKRPAILARDGQPMAGHATLTDFLVSWEAWRPPLADFNPVFGLDPDTYALTARGYAGPARCLNDSALDRPWINYPLALPDVPNAASELLYVSLLLADGVARHTICNSLDHRIESNESLPGDYGGIEQEQWRSIRKVLAKSKAPERPMGGIFDEDVRYDLLRNSCTTMALQTIDWANKRIHRRGDLDEPGTIRMTPDSIPPIVNSLVQGERTAALLQIPSALYWLVKHQTVVPGQSHKLLNEVGLLHHDDNGNILKRHFDTRVETPYGCIADNIIF